MEPVILTATRGRVTLRLVCVALGADLAVTLSGGDREHIGAVALAQPRPDRGEGPGPGATTSVLAILGHREDEVARAVAETLASRLGAVACVACGIHVDGISRSELEDVREMARELTDRLVDQLPV